MTTSEQLIKEFNQKFASVLSTDDAIQVLYHVEEWLESKLLNEREEKGKMAEEFWKESTFDMKVYSRNNYGVKSYYYNVDDIKKVFINVFEQLSPANKPEPSEEEIERIALEEYPVINITKSKPNFPSQTWEEDFNYEKRTGFKKGFRKGLSLNTERSCAFFISSTNTSGRCDNCNKFQYEHNTERRDNDAVEFAKWLCENGWQSSNGLFYSKNFGRLDKLPEMKKADELYELFSKSKGKG